MEQEHGKEICQMREKEKAKDLNLRGMKTPVKMYGELLSSVLVSHFEQEESQWKRRRLQG